MRNPGKKQVKPREVNWSETNTDVKHLTSENFDDFIKVNILMIIDIILY